MPARVLEVLVFKKIFRQPPLILPLLLLQVRVHFPLQLQQLQAYQVQVLKKRTV